MDFRCVREDVDDSRAKHDDLSSYSFVEQRKVEESIKKNYTYFRHLLDVETDVPELLRRRHETFLLKGLNHLSESYECLDASRPWLCYWILHSMELLDIAVPDTLSSQIADFLSRCQCPDGGFSGGPGQQAHLAPTYAAVNALCILKTDQAYSVINRRTLQKFLLAMKMPSGGYKMHAGGELDIRLMMMKTVTLSKIERSKIYRGAYCAASAANLTHITVPEMFEGTPEWIVSCQTYEGGFGGCPDMEAHGGYSFCGLAALILMNKEHLCDMKSLLRWTVWRQMSFEGGFQGRTNKLVDGCYSFWQGGAFPLIHLVLSEQGDEALSHNKWMFHQEALQEYLLICCQHPGGGLIDKPGKARDYYHTCYCLSGLSVAQQFVACNESHIKVIGNHENKLNAIHPVYNIGVEAAAEATRYFKRLPPPDEVQPIS